MGLATRLDAPAGMTVHQDPHLPEVCRVEGRVVAPDGVTCWLADAVGVPGSA